MILDKEKLAAEIEKLRSFSSKLKLICDNKEELVDQLNSISAANRASLYAYYGNSEGPIKSIRKEVAAVLKERNIELQELEAIIGNAMSANPASFGKMYKSWYNMLYTFLLADFRPEMLSAVTYISDSVIDALDARDYMVAKKFDFTGERETGSTRCWIAFVNKTHQSQKTAKQLFIDIEDGEVKYCVYDRPSEIQEGNIVIKKDEPINVDDLISTFQKHSQEIIDDVWVKQVNYWRVGTKDDNNNYWEEMKSGNKISIGWFEIGDLDKADVRSKKNIIQLLNDEGFYPNDNRIKSRKAGEIFNFYEGIQIGDIILAQDGETVLGVGRVNGEYAYNAEANFPHQKAVEWIVINPPLRNDIGLQTSVYQIEDDRKISEIEKVLNTPTTKIIETSLNNPPVNLPLNLILFGPPGTGKTFELLENYIPKFTLEQSKTDKTEFEFNEISKLPWWKVIALILATDGELSVPQIKEHPFLAYKLKTSETNSLDQTIWGQLSAHAVQESTTVNYTKRTEPLIFDKNENSVWIIVEDKRELVKDVFDLAEQIKNYRGETKTKNNFRFITFHQSFGYEDFIEGIKPKMSSEAEIEDAKIQYHIEDGLFYKCCEEAARLAGFITLKDCIENYTKSQRIEKFRNAQPFAIFIDEINRGNISSIFGELITLIEEDKRLTEHEIILELPYSKRRFAVPPNLHIIGTMNTADRSVEALDAALRRRFSFKEMAPEPALIKTVGKLRETAGVLGTINLQMLLETINKRIEKLLDRDHKIGHSYFLSVSTFKELKEALQNKIIPLLQEYFFGDYAKIGLVLGKGFVTVKEKDNSNIFADFSHEEGDFADKTIYAIEKPVEMEDDVFTEAIRLLLNSKVAQQ